MRVIFAALCLALAACAAPAPTAPPVAAAQPAASPVAAAEPTDPVAACRARGGEIEPICRMQKPTCVIRYSDAGRACSGDADCEGRCLAKNAVATPGEPMAGFCQATSNPCGCNTLVEGGRAGPTMCVD